MQTYTNPFEQNNEHTCIIHEIQFRSSFNETVIDGESIINSRYSIDLSFWVNSKT